MNYQQLLDFYTQNIEPHNPNDPTYNDRFNQWTNGLMQKAGVGTWEELPPDILVNPSYGQVQQAAASPAPVGNALVDLTGGNVRSALDSGIANAANGKSNQVQAAEQNGSFNNVSSTNQNTNQVNTQDQTTKTDNTTKQTGTTTGDVTTTGSNLTNNTQQGNTQQVQKTSGTSSTKVDDSLGLGGLISSSLADTGAADKTRLGVLTDIATTGGANWQSGVDQAVRNALSGPGMQGVGDAARSRAAGFSAAEAGRRNLDARIAAANGLGGPSAAGTLTQQAAPLLGQTTSTSGDTFGSTISNMVEQGQSYLNNRQLSSGTNTSDTSNIGNTISSLTGTQNTGSTGTTANVGKASGSSVGVATGNSPEQKSGGGCFVCSVYATQGLVDAEDVRAAVRYKLYDRKTMNMAVGYSLYGPLLARLVLASNFVGGLLLPIATRVLYEELRLAGRRKRFRLGAWTLHSIFHYGSAMLGFVARQFGVKVKTRDQVIANLLKSNNLYFEV